jgi:hypothetical protein
MLCIVYILCSPRATLNIVPLINIIAKLACPNPAEGAKQIENRKLIMGLPNKRHKFTKRHKSLKKLYKIVS